MGDSEPFVSAILKDLPEDSSVEDVLANSPKLQELAQQHNKLVYETKGIDSLSKDLTGKQFKREINKHTPEVIVLLLASYLNGNRLIIENTDDDLLEVIPDDAAVVRVSKRRSTDVILDRTDTDVTKSDKAKKVNDDAKLKDVEVSEDDDIFSTETLLAINSFKAYALIAAKILMFILLLAVACIIGIVIYLSFTSGKMPSDEIVQTLLTAALDLIKFMAHPTK